MKFCSKCNGLMKPVGKDNLECVNCGEIEKAVGEDITSKEKIAKKSERRHDVVEDRNVFATFDFKCKKCGYDKAEVIERQPYISDEDSLTFLKCGKCGFSQKLARKAY